MKKILFLILLVSCSLPDQYEESLSDSSAILGAEIIADREMLNEGETELISLYLIKGSGVKERADNALWSCDTPSGMIDPSGVFTAVKEGLCNITAQHGTLSCSIEIDVRRIPDYSQIKLTEIFYDPAGDESGREFIEIANYSDRDEDISGLKLIDGSTKSTPFVFPDGACIKSRGRVVVAQKRDPFYNDYGFYPDFEPFTFSLNNNGERVALLDSKEKVLDEIFIKGGSSEFPQPEGWGENGAPSASEGNSVSRKGGDSDTASDWEATSPSPDR